MKKLKTPQDVQRRNFLKTVASSGISTAALKGSALGLSLMASRAGQAEGGVNGIKRVVFFYIPDGAPPGTYTWNNGSLGTTSKGLEPVKDSVIVFDGCTTGGNGHGDGGIGILGGEYSATGSDTYDIKLEKLLGATTPFPSLQIGVETGGGSAITWRNYNHIVANDNPVTVFESLFASGVETGGPAEKRFKFALDHNKAELAEIKSKLGAFELQKLEQHQAQIEKVISNFENAQVPLPGCDNRTQELYNWNGEEIGHFTKVNNMQCENAVAALKCGLTNVISIQLSTNGAGFTADDDVLSTYGDYHGAIHSGQPARYAAYRAFLTDRFAYLIKLLRDTEDENGDSLLDTTIVLQVSCMGNGDAHDSVNAPFTMAGGKHMNVGRGMTVAHNYDLLDTISVALGVEGQVPQYGTGEVASILK
ncbi:DUF1552 domain-containing protein [Marinicellulosiphila megalodicopiae]|uniref:DUF1552 domain-containing protein n=1 Tax=Marinicellulosiphila megalodicopiae TaxID=2724896 RepID=UPI003BAFE985